MSPVSGRVLIAVAAIALCLSMAATFGLIHAVRQLYGRALEHQIWPSGPPCPVLSNSVAADGPKILLLGDSRIAEWGLPQMSGYRVINAGVGGITTAQLRLRAPQLLQEHQPEVAVIQAGINDLKILGVRPELSDEIVSRCLDNISEISRLCAEQGTEVIVLQIWPTGKIGVLRQFVWDAAIQRAIIRANQRFSRLPQTHPNVMVADLFEAGWKGSKLRSPFRDELHLRPEFYAALTPCLKQELEALRERPNAQTPAPE